MVMKLSGCLSHMIDLDVSHYQEPECRGKGEISPFGVGPFGQCRIGTLQPLSVSHDFFWGCISVPPLAHSIVARNVPSGEGPAQARKTSDPGNGWSGCNTLILRWGCGDHTLRLGG